MEAQQTADDGSELRIYDDVSDIVELEAQRIFDNTDYNVTVRGPHGGSGAEIAVYWDSLNRPRGYLSHDGERVNSFHKATIINEVLESPASVDLKSTDDGNRAVTFIAR